VFLNPSPFQFFPQKETAIQFSSVEQEVAIVGLTKHESLKNRRKHTLLMLQALKAFVYGT
jgi:hypothetical protein